MRRKIKIIVVTDEGIRIPLPSLSIMTIYNLTILAMRFKKDPNDKKTLNKVSREFSKLNKKDVRMLIKALPKESFELVNINNEEACIKIIVK